jgi:hypothetical protein
MPDRCDPAPPINTGAKAISSSSTTSRFRYCWITFGPAAVGAQHAVQGVDGVRRCVDQPSIFERQQTRPGVSVKSSFQLPSKV